MKHGDDVQGAVAFRTPEHETHRIAVENERPVAVDDALGIARRGGGVAYDRRIPFAQVVGEVVALGEPGDELVVETDRGEPGLGHLAALRHDDVVLDGLQLILDCVNDEGHLLVDEHHLILGVVDDVDEMVQREAEIRGVQGGPHAGDAEVEFEVTVVVQGHAGHMIAALYPQELQGMGELAGPLEIIGVGVTEDFVVGIDGNHFLLREILRRPQKKRSQQQRILHHGTLPPYLPCGSMRSIHMLIRDDLDSKTGAAATATA